MAAGLAKRRRKFQVVAPLVQNSRTQADQGYMRVELKGRTEFDSDATLEAAVSGIPDRAFS
jgi:hypothetical protein